MITSNTSNRNAIWTICDLLDDDDHVHVVANDSRHDTTWSQLAHSSLSRPTTAIVS